MAFITGLLNYFAENGSQIFSLLLEHIRLTAIAVGVAILIGVPLGILICYIRKASKPVLGVANVIQAIPSMAALTGTSYDCNPPGHYRAPTREEARRILAAYLTADVFLLGANAITMTGEIVNVDGVGSRVVGGIYGPDRIVVVAGINKLVPDERAARERIAFVAAPMNNLKYDRACACVKTGRCPSCDAPNRICNVTTILHKKPMRSDYHVILIGESLGF